MSYSRTTALRGFLNKKQSDNAMARSSLQPMLYEINERLEKLEGWFNAVQAIANAEVEADEDTT